MKDKIAIFWPGDAREKPNELALPNVEEATAQLERALKKLGRAAVPRRGLPLEAARGDREARADRRSDDRRVRALVLRPAHDRRRRRQGQPAAARQQLLRALAGPGRPAQHRRLPREPRTARSRASGPTRRTGRPTRRSWSGSTSGARPDASATPRTRSRYHAPISPTPPRSCAREVADEIRRPARADPDARRHLDGHDQRLLRPAPAQPLRLHRAQDRPGLDHRSRPAHRRQAHRRRVRAS